MLICKMESFKLNWIDFLMNSVQFWDNLGKFIGSGMEVGGSTTLGA